MSWIDERVVVIGAARQGTALSRYLAAQGAEVVLTDARNEDDLSQVRQDLADLPITWELGGHPLSLLDNATLVCPSGGVPLSIPIIVEAQRRGIPLSNDSQVFLEAAPCKVIGITGSAGKTTTTTLVGRMAQAAVGMGAVRRAFVGGNIGSPLIAEVDEMQAGDLAVMELSSFQLDLMAHSPQVAGLLNISPNHLDRHGSMQAYIDAKTHIFRHQSVDDHVVLGCEDQMTWSFAREVEANLLGFGFSLPANTNGAFVRDDSVWLRVMHREVEVLPLAEVQLRGRHNLLNVLAACALGAGAGLSAVSMAEGIRGFGGVEHRLEFVREWGGASWFNDSKATSPGMTVTAVQAFDEPLVVLVGGRDKDLPWDTFSQVAQERIAHVVAFGESAGIIQAALSHESPNYTLDVCQDLAEAVGAAAERAALGGVVLLAPGGTSFDEFTDYEARGRRYKDLVCDLPLKE